jgi:hypothetical protein
MRRKVRFPYERPAWQNVRDGRAKNKKILRINDLQKRRFEFENVNKPRIVFEKL